METMPVIKQVPVFGGIPQVVAVRLPILPPFFYPLADWTQAFMLSTAQFIEDNPGKASEVRASTAFLLDVLKQVHGFAKKYNTTIKFVHRRACIITFSIHTSERPLFFNIMQEHYGIKFSWRTITISAPRIEAFEDKLTCLIDEMAKSHKKSV
jgi:hypothetical protein